METVPAYWSLYFDEEYTDSDRRALLVRDLASFFESDGGWEHLHKLVVHGTELSLECDYERLRDGCGLGDLKASIERQPAEGLACIGAAAFQVDVQPSWCWIDTQVAAAARPSSPNTALLWANLIGNPCRRCLASTLERCKRCWSARSRHAKWWRNWSTRPSSAPPSAQSSPAP